jgi:hypothetical protein
MQSTLYSRANPQWPLTGSLENAFNVQRADPLVWADERDRTDAAEVRLRQLYAELGGVIGGSHKAERYMLSTRSVGMVGAIARN